MTANVLSEWPKEYENRTKIYASPENHRRFVTHVRNFQEILPGPSWTKYQNKGQAK